MVVSKESQRNRLGTPNRSCKPFPVKSGKIILAATLSISSTRQQFLSASLTPMNTPDRPCANFIVIFREKKSLILKLNCILLIIATITITTTIVILIVQLLAGNPHSSMLILLEILSTANRKIIIIPTHSSIANSSLKCTLSFPTSTRLIQRGTCAVWFQLSVICYLLLMRIPSENLARKSPAMFLNWVKLPRKTKTTTMTVMMINKTTQILLLQFHLESGHSRFLHLHLISSVKIEIIINNKNQIFF